MALRLAERLRAPIFDDEEQTRVAGLLHVIYILLLLLLSLLFLVRLVIGLDGHWVIYPLLIVLLIALLAGLRRGFIYSGGLMMTGVLIAYAVFGSLSSGGLSSPSLQMLAIVIMFAALLGVSRFVIGVTAAALLVLLGIAAIELNGYLPPVSVPHTSVSIFIGSIASVTMIGLMLTLIIVSLKNALRQAHLKELEAASLARAAEQSHKLAEDVLASMVESVITLDAQAKIRSINAATTQLLGFTEDELRGAAIGRVLVDDRSAEDSIVATICAHRDKTYRTKSGRHIAVRFSNALLRDDEGKLSGIVCVASDIRRDKEIEQNLREAKELAEDASKAKSRFLANMSHIGEGRESVYSAAIVRHSALWDIYFFGPRWGRFGDRIRACPRSRKSSWRHRDPAPRGTRSRAPRSAASSFGFSPAASRSSTFA